MKSKRIAALAALIITVSIAIGGCVSQKPVPEGEGGSDIAIESQSTDAQTTEATLTADDKLIALTFDDGPSSEHTNRILDILEKNNSTATFFVVGYNIEKNVDTIKRAQAMGCEIGNHTDSHKILTKCDYATIRTQVDNPNQMLKKLTGNEIKLFRAPGGAFKGIKQNVGMPLIQWSIDTEDWKFKDAAHPDRTEEKRNADLRKIADDVVQSAEKGDIILMHDIYNFTADLCELIIPELTEKGFKLVTVSEMYEVYGESLKNGEVYYEIRFEEPSKEPISQSNAILEAGEYTVKTNGGALNVRVEPKQETSVIEKLANGDKVSVVKSVPGWAFVKTSKSSGWVNASYLTKN